jgi:hypothetical protein
MQMGDKIGLFAACLSRDRANPRILRACLQIAYRVAVIYFTTQPESVSDGHDKDRTRDPYHVKVVRDTNSRVKSKRKGR